MLQITLRQLRYFDALARHGHFGRAAEACSISQPALSMQIKEMEEALGGVLLERSARQVTLTKFGEEIVQRVRDGRLRTNIGHVATLDDALAALDPTERLKGKTVIRVRP